MHLTKNQLTNISILSAIALDIKSDKMSIKSVKENNNVISLILIRKLTISELKQINEKFKTNISTTRLNYSLQIDILNNDIVFKIEDILKMQLSFDDDMDKINEQLIIVDNYNKQITHKLKLYDNLLFNTFKTDSIDTWTFYFVTPNLEYIGFANGNLSDSHCIQVKQENFSDIENVYNSTYNVVGTLTDAQCLCLRRNYNSSYKTWKHCKINTSAESLINNFFN